jgi:SAM-dependent methyltransferase
MEPPVSSAPASWSGALAASAADVVLAARALGVSPWASTLRAWCVPYAFHSMERVFATDADPSDPLRLHFEKLAAFLRAAAASEMGDIINVSAQAAGTERTVEQTTGEHYGRLFREFDAASFAAEPARLLRERLTRNDVALPDLGRARVLDAGCGGGRYSVAWHLLGAGEVVGVDLSEPGIADARARVASMKIDRVRFEHMDVVELPVEPDSFDIVFSNGVLHHTRDWKRGVHALVRALKRGGLGWLYLIENPGGYFWDTIEMLREVMRGELHEPARVAVASLGIPANRVFYMLDHVMVPINLRLTAEEIAGELEMGGAKGIRRLERGYDFDRVEHVHQQAPHARLKYGAGEHRFVFTK